MLANYIDSEASSFLWFDIYIYESDRLEKWAWCSYYSVRTVPIQFLPCKYCSSNWHCTHQLNMSWMDFPRPPQETLKFLLLPQVPKVWWHCNQGRSFPFLSELPSCRFQMSHMDLLWIQTFCQVLGWVLDWQEDETDKWIDLYYFKNYL